MLIPMMVQDWASIAKAAFLPEPILPAAPARTESVCAAARVESVSLVMLRAASDEAAAAMRPEFLPAPAEF